MSKELSSSVVVENCGIDVDFGKVVAGMVTKEAYRSLFIRMIVSLRSHDEAENSRDVPRSRRGAILGNLIAEPLLSSIFSLICVPHSHNALER